MESVFSSLRDPWARKWLWFALALNLVAAFQSWGFHHFDEQFQILEFASYKLGNSPVTDLPWEFDARIRPWFQPAGVVLLARVFKDPFDLALVLRLISAVLGWLSTVFIASCCSWWFKSEQFRRWAILGSCFLWFFPYLHARPSSDGWATSLFFLGFIPVVFRIRAHLAQADPARLRLPAVEALVCGALLGLAFETRYQVGIMIAAGGLWALRYGRLDSSSIAYLGLGLLAAVLLGTGLDAWGYGSMTLAPWNYLVVNLIQGRAAEFGVDPWWDYFWMGLGRGLPPLSLFLMVGVVLSWALKPRSSLTWITLAFVLVHLLIAHKEFRFLFPILPAVPIQVAMVFQSLEDRGVRWQPVARVARLATKATLGLLLIINSIALIVATLLPPRMEILVFRQIYNESPLTLVSLGTDPYQMASLPVNFYRHPETEVLIHNDPDQLPRDRPFWLLQQGLESPQIPATCERHYTTMPDWLARSEIYGLLERAGALEWVLFQCRPLPG